MTDDPNSQRPRAPRFSEATPEEPKPLPQQAPGVGIADFLAWKRRNPFKPYPA